MFGTMVVAGPTPDVIYALIPDSTTSTADDISPADLQHVVGLSLGPAENLSATLPQDELHLAFVRQLATANTDCGPPELLDRDNTHTPEMAVCE